MRTIIRTVVAPSVLALAASVSSICLLAPAASAVSPLPASDYAVSHQCATPAIGEAGCLSERLEPRTTTARARTHPLAMTHNGAATARALTPAEGGYGLRPADLHSAYALPSTPPSAQTIAIIDAYNDLGAESDLKVYDKEFHLPECTEAEASHCFKKVNQNGETGNLPFPQNTAVLAASEALCATGIGTQATEACKEVEEADGWAGEISLDIETAHAVCQGCRVVLVEANSASVRELDTAVETAVRLGANEISNSWGGPECGPGPGGTECEVDNPVFNQPGVVITAAAGDNGYLDWSSEKPTERGYTDYPASSPHVIAVGGTRLALGPGNAWAGETVWNDGGESSTGVIEGAGAGGGGCSVQFIAPPWQQSLPDWLTTSTQPGVGCGAHRAVADVSADADPYTGVAVYDSTPFEGSTGWGTVGGTSLASPIVASVFALAGGAHGVEYPARTLYENEVKSPISLHDVTSGSNGRCSEPFNPVTGHSCTEAKEAASCTSHPICLAGQGYDGPTGMGTPDGIAAFEPSEPVEPPKEVHKEPPPPETGKETAKTSEPGSGTTTPENPPSSQTPPGGGTEGTGGSTTGTGTQPTAASATVPSKISRPRLSALALTRGARIALYSTWPPVAQIGFSFTLNAAAHVRITLAKRVARNGRAGWQTLPDTLTIAAPRGRTRARLNARGRLTPGLYRLTFTPAHGTARTLTFRSS